MLSNIILILYIFVVLLRIYETKTVICTECEEIATELRTFVHRPFIVEKTQNYFSKYFCNHLGHYRQPCVEFIKVKVAFIIDQLTEALENPEKFCQEIDLCGYRKLLWKNKNRSKYSNQNF